MPALTTAPPILSADPRVVYTGEPIFRLTVEQYHRLIDQGDLTPDDPVELVEGVLLFKMPKKRQHTTCNWKVNQALSSLLSEGFHSQSQEPITLGDSEPEPDVAVIRGDREDFLTAHPHAPDVLLVVEISDSTLERDRGIKLRSYARAGIANYWIVNLNDRTVEVFTNPTGQADTPAYADRQVFGPADSIPLPAATASVPVASFF